MKTGHGGDDDEDLPRYLLAIIVIGGNSALCVVVIACYCLYERRISRLATTVTKPVVEDEKMTESSVYAMTSFSTSQHMYDNVQ